jgi:hypothetical protein
MDTYFVDFLNRSSDDIGADDEMSVSAVVKLLVKRFKVLYL